MNRTFNLGKIFGIQFRLHFTWFIIFILLTGILVYPNLSSLSYWIIGVSTSLLFFASVVLHELAHCLVGRANGIPTVSITLFIFGGISQMTGEVMRPGTELRIAIAGPASSLLLSGIFGLLWLLIKDINTPISAMASWLAIMNLILAIFNLIPGFPLDGGRVLRSVLWHITGDFIRSSRIASKVGQGVGYLLILTGIIIVILRPLDFSWFDGIWIALIGWFLEGTASASYNQIRQQKAESNFSIIDITSPDITITPPSSTTEGT